MYCISIQIRPKAAPTFDRTELLTRARPLRSPEIDAYEEKGKLLLSFNFFTEFPHTLWPQLRKALFDSSEFGQILTDNCVILCEDENTEQCYLLHHYDAQEQLDELPVSAH